ncbi:MAG: 2-oxo acid dehydrogenase subunit E2 [Tannerella sp.]|jgi:pyruvate dehydrogenase E2 component (dihydrolipoamide acetyltransferase)|nr:2-oxo acid dehydrogenase subunit E2 [Tannerella sp.]
MATVVIMPKQGQSVESCILTEIKKNKGDTVEIGDSLFAYETDKASFEEEAKVAGTVLEIFYAEGDEIPVLSNVMVIGDPGEPIEEFRQTSETPAIHVPTIKGQPTLTGFGTVLGLMVESPGTTSSISPRARILAEKNAMRTSNLSGSGPQGRVIERDVQAMIEAFPKSTPLAKAMIKKDGLQMPETGNGPAGMVRGTDLKTLKESSRNPKLETSASDSTIVPLTNIRKRIAKAMLASLQNSAQLTHHLSTDARRILDLRKKIKEAIAKGYPADITLNDMICYATIVALRKFPQANAHFLGDNIRSFSKVHLGFAVDTDRGLMVPVVKNAGEMSIQELAIRLKGIAGDCKKGSVNPDLLSSEAASFTVSNLGNYGVEIFTPIINLPQVAILGVNTIVPRPKDRGDGNYDIVPHLGLSLTYDHRALDGGEATRFLKQIAIEIENLDFEI